MIGCIEDGVRVACTVDHRLADVSAGDLLVMAGAVGPWLGAVAVTLVIASGVVTGFLLAGGGK